MGYCRFCINKILIDKVELCFIMWCVYEVKVVNVEIFKYFCLLIFGDFLLDLLDNLYYSYRVDCG